LLPEIAIRAPKSVIGRTTEESILSGLFYGYGSLCRGFIDLMKKQIGGNPKVVMTGGHTQLMKKFIQRDIRVVDEDLVFKGLSLLLKNANQ
jgi:type III pantothenate kinase